MRKRKRSPQEDKVLSYGKDRRNTYGQSTGGSRRSIRFRKQWVNGTYRSHVHDALGARARDPDEIADAVNSIRRKEWRKSPDSTLGSIVEWKVADQRSEDDESPARDRLRRRARHRWPGYWANR